MEFHIYRHGHPSSGYCFRYIASPKIALPLVRCISILIYMHMMDQMYMILATFKHIYLHGVFMFIPDVELLLLACLHILLLFCVNFNIKLIAKKYVLPLHNLFVLKKFAFY